MRNYFRRHGRLRHPYRLQRARSAACAESLAPCTLPGAAAAMTLRRRRSTPGDQTDRHLQYRSHRAMQDLVGSTEAGFVRRRSASMRDRDWHHWRSRWTAQASARRASAAIVAAAPRRSLASPVEHPDHRRATASPFARAPRHFGIEDNLLGNVFLVGGSPRQAVASGDFMETGVGRVPLDPHATPGRIVGRVVGHRSHHHGIDTQQIGESAYLAGIVDTDPLLNHHLFHHSERHHFKAWHRLQFRKVSECELPAIDLWLVAQVIERHHRHPAKLWERVMHHRHGRHFGQAKAAARGETR